jgi:DNA-binding CsgD family transcriptional regulator/PAS domain-containing protein
MTMLDDNDLDCERTDDCSPAPASSALRPERCGYDAESDLFDLVGDIHEAALAPELWPAVLERVGDALGGMAIHLGIQRLPAGIDFVAFSRLDPERVQTFRRRYASVQSNPVLTATAALPTGRLLPRRAVIDDLPYYTSEMYAEVIRPERMVDWSIAFLVKEPHLVAPIVISQPSGRPPLDSRGKALLDRLLPHFRRSIQITERLGRLEAGHSAALDALDHLPCGALVVDGDGRILDHNGAAQRLLSAQDGLTATQGRLSCAKAADATRLRELIAGAAATTQGREIDRPGGAMSVARPSGRRPYAILVGPLRTPGAGHGRGSPAAVAFVSDPESLSASPEAALRQLYGLTPAEASLAGCLLAGHDLNEAAAMQEIGRETARTHLRRIFAKTETKRQSELLRLLLRGPAGLEPAAAPQDQSGL